MEVARITPLLKVQTRLPHLVQLKAPKEFFANIAWYANQNKLPQNKLHSNNYHIPYKDFIGAYLFKNADKNLQSDILLIKNKSGC